MLTHVLNHQLDKLKLCELKPTCHLRRNAPKHVQLQALISFKQVRRKKFIPCTVVTIPFCPHRQGDKRLYYPEHRFVSHHLPENTFEFRSLQMARPR